MEITEFARERLKFKPRHTNSKDMTHRVILEAEKRRHRLIVNGVCYSAQVGEFSPLVLLKGLFGEFKTLWATDNRLSLRQREKVSEIEYLPEESWRFFTMVNSDEKEYEVVYIADGNGPRKISTDGRKRVEWMLRKGDSYVFFPMSQKYFSEGRIDKFDEDYSYGDALYELFLGNSSSFDSFDLLSLAERMETREPGVRYFIGRAVRRFYKQDPKSLIDPLPLVQDLKPSVADFLAVIREF